MSTTVTRILLTLGSTVLLAACASATPATNEAVESVAAVTATAEPTPEPTAEPTPTPTPTPEPTPDLAALGEEYLALLEPANRHICSFDDAIATDLALYVAYVSTVAKNERTLTDALRQMAFPPEIQPHVDARIEAGASYHSVLTLIAAATSFEEVNLLAARSEAANFAARDASNLIRGDLGLPGSPTCEEVNAAP